MMGAEVVAQRPVQDMVGELLAVERGGERPVAHTTRCRGAVQHMRAIGLETELAGRIGGMASLIRKAAPHI